VAAVVVGAWDIVEETAKARIAKSASALNRLMAEMCLDIVTSLIRKGRQLALLLLLRSIHNRRSLVLNLFLTLSTAMKDR
jgi:hypothetical protein